MKPKIDRKDLQSTANITNPVIDMLSHYELTAEDSTLHTAYLLYQYHSEMESGGHESLFSWFEAYILETGITNYLHALIGGLEEVGATKIAGHERTYGQKLWDLYIALENDEITEKVFYEVVEKADEAYYEQSEAFGELLDAYFVKIHTDLIEVVE